MAVDRLHRDRMIEAINLFANAKITSDTFDDLIYEALGEGDSGLNACFYWQWTLYSDNQASTLNPSPITLMSLKRIVAFLASDLEYAPTFKRTRTLLMFKSQKYATFWPFASQRDWRSHRHFAGRFNSDLHTLSIASSMEHYRHLRSA